MIDSIYIEETDDLKAKANKIVQLYAGAPTALKDALKKLKLTYVKVNKGGLVFYTIRKADTRQTVIKIKL